MFTLFPRKLLHLLKLLSFIIKYLFKARNYPTGMFEHNAYGCFKVKNSEKIIRTESLNFDSWEQNYCLTL